MGIVRPAYAVLASVLAEIVLSLSCNNTPVDVPFPFPGGRYPQPVSRPLQLGPAHKLNWVAGSVRPVIKPLDIRTLPSLPFDTSGFKPVPRPPRETPLHFGSLPDTAFNLADLPSKPLGFKTTAFAPPALVRAAPPLSNTGPSFPVLEVGQGQGLRGNLVTALLRGRNGFLWIAGNAGLCRFDGEYMQSFLPGMISQIITSLAEDHQGRIWFITQYGGIGMVDPQKMTVSRSDIVSTPGNDLSAMMTDAAGRIWVTNTTGGGVVIIDPGTGTFKHLDRHTGLSGDVVLAALEDSHNKIWLTLIGGGIDIIDLREGKIRHLGKAGGLSTDSVWSITMDGTGKLWASNTNGVDAIDVPGGSITGYTTTLTRGSLSFKLLTDNRNRIWVGTTNGIILLDPRTDRVRFIDRSAGLDGDIVTAMLQDDDQRVWVATPSGLNIIPQYGETTHLLGKRSVSALFQDAEGRIWAGLSGPGIQILSRRNNRMIRLDTKSGLSDGYIQAFAGLENGVAVSSDGGLDLIDLSRRRLEHIGKKEGLPGDTTYSVIKDDHANLWLTGPHMGLVFIDSARKTIRHAGRAQGLADDDIVDVKQDSRGLIWISTHTAGVAVIDLGNGTIRTSNNAPGLSDTCYRILMPDRDGRMWIGTDKGIYVGDAQKGTLVSISTAEGLSDDHILSLNPYKGSVLAGTNHKVTIITPSTGEWQVSVLDKSEDLNKESASWNTDLVTQEGEFLWGDDGISLIKGIKTDSSVAQTYVTSIQVLNQPLYFAYAPTKAEPEWQQGLRWDSVSGPYNLPVNLRIPYDRNYLQFQFAQAHLGRQDTTLYCYMLEGVDKQWSAPAGNPFTENYMNLSPGVYTLKVSSRLRNGRWGSPSSFRFTVMPPWWQTWWAYLLWILVAAAGLWGFIYLRSKRLVRENKMLEQRIKQRTAEVLAQKEALTAQRDHLEKTLEELQTTQKQLMQSEKMASLGELTAGIAHEIQNPLNFVNNFAEVSIELTEELKEELDKLDLPPETKTYIDGIADDLVQNQQKINFHGKRADSIIKGMLQHSRASTGQREPSDINALADEYLRLSYHGLRAKDKSFNAKLETAFDTDLPKINIIPQDVGRVLLNLFTNAFYSVMLKKKTASADFQPMVRVSTQRIGNQVEIRVRDNGMGIPQSVLDKIYNPFFTTKPTGEGTGLGLSLSYDIIAKGHGGSIRVETKEGEFAEFIILLPL